MRAAGSGSTTGSPRAGAARATAPTSPGTPRYTTSRWATPRRCGSATTPARTRLRHRRAGPGRLGVALVAVAGHDHRVGRGARAACPGPPPRSTARRAATRGAAGPRHRPSVLREPETPFVAKHAALALAGDHETCRAPPSSSATPGVLPTPPCAPWWHRVCRAARSPRGALGLAWRTLTDLLPVLVRVGGSAAQREVVEETLLLALVHDGRAEQASPCSTDGSTAVRRASTSAGSGRCGTCPAHVRLVPLGATWSGDRRVLSR